MHIQRKGVCTRQRFWESGEPEGKEINCLRQEGKRDLHLFSSKSKGVGGAFLCEGHGGERRVGGFPPGRKVTLETCIGRKVQEEEESGKGFPKVGFASEKSSVVVFKILVLGSGRTGFRSPLCPGSFLGDLGAALLSLTSQGCGKDKVEEQRTR